MELVSFRRATASLAFAANGLLWLVNALFGPPQLWAATTAMTLIYLVAYFSVSAGWFWGRWFGMGLCYFGSLYLLGAIQNPEYAPFFLVIGGSHLLALLCLFGSSMASVYEGAPEWRLAFNIDEDMARRMGRSVQSGATTLPILVLQLLGPRPESLFLTAGILGLALAGMGALIRLKTWSLIALASAGALFLSTLDLPMQSWIAPGFLGSVSLSSGSIAPGFLSSVNLNTGWMILAGTLGLCLPLVLWTSPLCSSLCKKTGR